jgi:hypothetical protein
LGVFYALSFLHFYLKLELPDIAFFTLLSAFIVVARNTLVMPFLGMNILSNWVFSRLRSQVDSQEIHSEVFLFLKDPNCTFTEFDSRFSSPFPLMNGEKNAYSLTTRRTMFQVLRTMALSVPGKEQSSTVLRSTLGTTLAGSAAITIYTTGLQSDTAVLNSYKATVEKCNQVLSHAHSTEAQRNIARELQERAVVAKKAWFHDAGTNTTIRGAKILVGEHWASAFKSSTQEISKQVSELHKISHLEGPISNHEMAYFTEKHGFQKFQVPSPLEFFF